MKSSSFILSVVRALDFGTTLTSLTFSPDGGSLYVGTKDGYLLVQNLRDLETKPKRIVLDPSGGSVIGLCVQVRYSDPTCQSITYDYHPLRRRKIDLSRSPTPNQALSLHHHLGRHWLPLPSSHVRLLSGLHLLHRLWISSTRARARHRLKFDPLY
jgi:hypothetical protein